MQRDEMLGSNHNSAADCTPWGLSGSGCRSDHQVLSSCHGLDTPKEHCQVLKGQPSSGRGHGLLFKISTQKTQTKNSP